MSDSPRLEQIQRWMLSVITHPGGVAEGVDSAEARRHVDVSLDNLSGMIRPSLALDSAERLEIYVDAYYERLLECLAEEFVVTRAALGDDLFGGIAFGYLQHSPSRSYTLNQLGAEFPRFLAEKRLHAGEAPAGAAPSWDEFIVELATYERLLRDVFDAVGTERGGALTAEDLARVPAEGWADLRLKLAPCVRLHVFEHPVHEFWSAVKQGESPSALTPRATRLALGRRNFQVERQELSPLEFALLAGIAAGSPLGPAIAAAVETLGEDEPLTADLSRSFARWATAGLFLNLA